MKPRVWNLRFFIPCLCIAQPTFAFPNLEFEVGAGLASGDAQAPALNARIGVNPWNSLTVSLRGLAVIGRQGTFIPGGRHGDASGYQGHAIFAELRYHTGVHSRIVRPFVALGLGVGKLVSSNCDCEEQYPIRGRLSHYEQLSGGARILFAETFWVSLELGGNLWHGLTREKGPNEPPYNVYGLIRPAGALFGVTLLLSFGVQSASSVHALP